MNDKDKTRTPALDDAILQEAALRQLLALHPIQLTLAELVRELTGEAAGEFEARDGVERAVRELAAAGLVHRNGDVVLPSRAALRLYELFD
jgi:hypothetical protein